MDFHFGQKELKRAADESRRHGWRTKSMCVLFNVTADTVQKDGIMYAWLNIRQASGERGGTGTRRCGAQPGHGNQALVQTLDLFMQFHTLEFHCLW